MKRNVLAVMGAAVLATGSCGCAASYEGSGTKDAASAEQLAQHTENTWLLPVERSSVEASDASQGAYGDGVYMGRALGMSGPVGVTLLVQDGYITCLETTQGGETQSVGGYEAIRDGRYAAMIDAAQGSDIDTIAGATITTAAVRAAVDDALDQAARAAADPAAASATPGSAAGDPASDQAVRVGASRAAQSEEAK